MPHFLQNLFVTGYNIKAYKKRHGGNYKKYFKILHNNRDLSLTQLQSIQQERFINFLNASKKRSKFYQEYPIVSLDNISILPIVKKEDLRKKINEVYTIDKKNSIVSKTGGTTGKSLEVLFTKKNMQERFALMDYHKQQFGYKLGKKTAWFSGKSLLSKRDLIKKRFWKTDYLNKVRYYSTFHIKEEYLSFYLENLIKYKPEYLVGFPSTMVAIAEYGVEKKYDFPEKTIKAIFPTAETLSKSSRNILQVFFKTNVYDQYASSEGAPFIFECKNHRLHLELQSGVFEVLDSNNNQSNKGRLVTTSFTTEGTPLIRYDIGDKLELSDETCSCGNNNPLVDKILGRIDDFIYSPENGKINLGNISNILKGTKGIKKFQVHQNQINKLEILISVDQKIYDKSIEKKFLLNWRERVGKKMQLQLCHVDDIPVEKSGKYRMVKNHIKHKLNE